MTSRAGVLRTEVNQMISKVPNYSVAKRTCVEKPPVESSSRIFLLNGSAHEEIVRLMEMVCNELVDKAM